MMPTRRKTELCLSVAYAARLLVPAEGHRSATLIVRRIAFLAVEVFFHSQPIEGLEIEFYKCRDSGYRGDRIGKKLTTNHNGIAYHPEPVPIGHYFCLIEHQPLAMITTVQDKMRPFILVLPIGRPVCNIGNEVEFDSAWLSRAEPTPIDE